MSTLDTLHTLNTTIKILITTKQLSTDFTYTKNGVRIFSCPPNACNDQNYQKLISNTMKAAIFNSIWENPKTKHKMALFDVRIKLEEERYSIKHKDLNWSTNNRQITLENAIGKLLSNEPHK